MVCLRIREMAKRIHKSVLFETCFSLFNNQKAAPGLLNEGCLGRLFKTTCATFVKDVRIKPCVCGILLILSFVSGHAQQNNQKRGIIDVITQGMQIGDTLSAVHLSSVHNHLDTSITVPSQTAELTIIDFWATWCGACIAYFPEIISLQETFAGRVRFVAVSKETSGEIETFTENWRKSGRPVLNFPVVSEDTVLNTTFSYRVLPHYVWVDREGVVVAITNSTAVKADLIEQVLEGDNSNVRQKEDLHRDYDRTKPLLYRGELEKDGLFSYSQLSGFQEGIGSGHFVSTTRKGVDPNFARLTVRNVDIVYLFQLAFSDLVEEPFTFFKLDGSVQKELRPELSGDELKHWIRDGNRYCYEIILPQSKGEQLIPYMRQNILKSFPEYQASVEQIDTDFWVLKCRDKERLRSKGGEQVIDNSLRHFTLQNAILFPFVDRLDFINRSRNNPPVIDETQIDFKVDLDVETDMRDIDSLNSALAPYSLYFEIESRPTPTLVISESHTKPI